MDIILQPELEQFIREKITSGQLRFFLSSE
jgi:hypothetical protein